jgi:hypothetical protein
MRKKAKISSLIGKIRKRRLSKTLRMSIQGALMSVAKKY